MKKFKKILIPAVLIVLGSVLLLPFSKKEGGSPFSRLLSGTRRSAVVAEENLTAAVKVESLQVPILLYHYIEDNSDPADFMRTSMATRPYFFEIQMKYLSTHGYTTISPSDLKEALEGKIALPEKPIILTFDDGFRDYYFNAFPILKKYNLAAIVYLIANHIGRSGNLTAQMIREMIDSGVFEFGSHTLNHVWLSQVSPAGARREIFESKKILSEMFNYSIRHFAYPGGFEAPWVVELVREAGYETAVATKAGIVQTPDSLLTLKRLRVGNLGEAEFAALIEGKRTNE